MSKEEMLSKGFTYVGTCNCDGITNYKYSKDGYLFYIRPKRKEFHVKKHVNYLKNTSPYLNLMQQKKKSFLQKLKGIFGTKLVPYLVEEKYKIVPAFSIGGVDYWMFDNAYEVPTGRMFAAMTVYEEMERGADRKYILDHCEAVDKVCEDPKKISIKNLVLLNKHLRERAELSPFPDYIYKLASVIFFDKSEALHFYDQEYNERKIKKWKAQGGSLDFFSQTPLKELVPSLNMPEADTRIYSMVFQKISEIHRELLSGIL